MNINFLMNQATFLRYYVPLAAEAKKRGHTVNFFLGSIKKYCDPYLKNNKENITQICSYFNFNIYDIHECHKFDGISFVVEGNCTKHADRSKQKLISLTSMNDSYARYNGPDAHYVNEVDHVIFPSKSLAKQSNSISEKNLYLGSPKYDVLLDKPGVLKQYRLDENDKYALVLYPKLRDLRKINIDKIYDYLHKLGYKILVKTRAKNPVLNPNHKGDYYFHDVSWFPSTTMELLEVSDIAINFSSTAIKEYVLCKTPVINFDIKPFNLIYDFLYNYDYAIQLKPDADFELFKNSVAKLTTKDLENEFNLAIKDHLFERGNVSKKICDALNIL